MDYLLLLVAIVAEVAATSSLRATEGFTRLVPSLLVVAAYALAFLFMSLALRTMSTGIAYAIWSGIGIVLVSAIAWLRYDERLDAAALAGLGLIIAGVVVVNVYSASLRH